MHGISLHPLEAGGHWPLYLVIAFLLVGAVFGILALMRARQARQDAEDGARRERQAREHAEALMQEARRLREQEERLARESGRIIPKDPTTPTRGSSDGWGRTNGRSQGLAS